MGSIYKEVFAKYKSLSNQTDNTRHIQLAKTRYIQKIMKEGKITKKELLEICTDDYETSIIRFGRPKISKFFEPLARVPLYVYLALTYFDEVDFMYELAISNNLSSNLFTREKILDNDYFKSVLDSMHEINSAICGNFMDYLLRRMICEITKKEFDDVFASEQHDMYGERCTDKHICNKSCYTDKINSMCPKLCYCKVKDTKLYKTSTILKEILILSYAHPRNYDLYSWELNIEVHDKFIDIIENINSEDFLSPLYDFLNRILINFNICKLNQTCNDKNYSGIYDALIGSTLYDFKCVKKIGSNIRRNYILSLLVYAFIEYQNNGTKIDNICIINVYTGLMETYNIENIPKENMNLFLEDMKKKLYLTCRNSNNKENEYRFNQNIST